MLIPSLTFVQARQWSIPPTVRCLLVVQSAMFVDNDLDYSAPLRETREVEPKFKQTKLIALFTRVSQDLLKTRMESNGTGNAVSSDGIYSWVIRNIDNGAGFYTLQQADTASRAIVTFAVYLTTSIGAVTVSSVQLSGRQSKILTTDYHFGNHTLLYSSADILTYGIFDETALVLYLDIGQVGEFAFKNTQISYTKHGSANISTSTGRTNDTTSYNSSSYTSYTYTQTSGSTVLRFSNGVMVYLLDVDTAWAFFAPATKSNPNVSPSDQVFVLGPYNVRNVTLDGSTVSLLGDNANSTSLEVYAGGTAQSIVWNGMELATKRTAYGSLTATAPGADDRTVQLPTLSWVAADSLPEKSPTYDDSRWTICNKTTTLSPTAPLTLPVLFSVRILMARLC